MTMKNIKNLGAIGKRYVKLLASADKDYQAAKAIADALNKRHSFLMGSWIKRVIVPIAQAIAKKHKWTFETFGPFGLSHEVGVHFYDKDKQLSECLTFVDFCFESGKLYIKNGTKDENGLTLSAVPANATVEWFDTHMVAERLARSAL
jgi:hypothetical protein